MMGYLTKRQKDALEYIQIFYDEHGYPPTIREIQDGMGYQSSSSAFEVVKKLEEKGFISRESKLPRAMVILKGVI